MLTLKLPIAVSLALASLVHAAPSRVYERATFLKGTHELLKQYDYVIVGGGTSALTVADRLTEDGGPSKSMPC